MFRGCEKRLGKGQLIGGGEGWGRGEKQKQKKDMQKAVGKSLDEEGKALVF